MNISTHKKSEVDLRVSQEIKNYEDFMYQTNQKLNRLNEDITSLSYRQDKVCSNHDVDMSNTFISFENFCFKVNERLHAIENRVSNFEKSMDERLNEALSKMGEFLLESISRVEVDKKIERCDAHLKALVKFVEQLDSEYTSRMSSISSNVNDKINELRKELTVIPPEVDPVKKYADDKFDVWKINFDGLVKEIALLKKSQSYSEKRFENLYTLIERLKVGK